MYRKKSGFNKQGSMTHEQMFIIFELVIFAFFMYILVSFVQDVEENTILAKNYLARDIAVLTNTMYSAPQDMVYIYAENTSKFRITIGNNLVSVDDIDTVGGASAKLYWFATEADSDFSAGSFVGVNNLEFIKGQSFGGSNMGIIETLLEIPSTSSIRYKGPLTNRYKYPRFRGSR